MILTKTIRKTMAACLAVTMLATAISFVPVGNASAASDCTKRTFRRGNYNQQCVEYVQRMLNISRGSNLSADGDFGRRTTNAVRAWQQDHRSQGLDVDGVVGPETWKSLCRNGSQYRSLADAAGCNGSGSNCVDETFSTTQNARSAHCVATIQRMVSATGITYIDDDGHYGTVTKTAVRAVQSKFGTTHEQGAVRQDTWKVLCNYHPSGSYQEQRYQGYREAAGCR